MEHTIDIDSIDYRIGHMSGVALAKTDATLDDDTVATAGSEAFDALSIRNALSKPLFLAGHVAGYKNYLGGLV